ncbi:ABC transporter substrate-binding protein [Bradyrhizobium sp. CB3481]|uniref:ABC transporter substrate-binding protein n=1 Tax=Bradyrhizobium sp. CB3481 TaxID=3039158 RepID=UPI0024B199F5|nr:ABC transporter substrate-binding protein [Bradyrhizobium sp. CB3481]WFU14556.1 ABC transporter substrate-binding protein [Bradyrhizobium sp. CB3481]
MKNRSGSILSRRTVLAGTASVLAAPMLIKPSRAQSNSVTFTSYGGSFQEALEKHVMKGFTEETGIKVNIVPAPELARIKAQLLTGNVEWDIYSGAGAEAAAGSKQGFWEKLDPSLFDLEDLVVRPESDRLSWNIYTSGIAWDPQKYGPGKHPTNFAEYFDLNKFPGRRLLFRTLRGSPLEVALLADGVPSKDIYPLDLNRALKVLDRIRPSIATWVESTPQSISLVQTGEADFTFTYATRVKATTETGGGKPLAFSFEQNLIYSEDMALLKGAPNKENAKKLISYFVRPEVQARVMNQTGLIPVSRKAVPLLTEQTRKWQPNFENPKNLIVNNAYWADNFEVASRRFKEWILG